MDRSSCDFQGFDGSGSSGQGSAPKAKRQGHGRRPAADYDIAKKTRVLLEGPQATIEPNSEFGRSLNYMLNHWHGLTLFLRKPGVPLTNNICERLLKTMIRYRKNSSFYRSLRGARLGDIYMSVLQTARLNQVSPHDYLGALLEHPEEVATAPGAWLPWNYEQALAATTSAAA